MKLWGILAYLVGYLVFSLASVLASMSQNIWLAALLLIGIVLVSAGTLISDRMAKGTPLKSIRPGSYPVVGLVPVVKDRQEYYQLLLEQEGEVKFYTLPKDMIVHRASVEKAHILEVIEKAGLRKATLYSQTGDPE